VTGYRAVRWAPVPSEGRRADLALLDPAERERAARIHHPAARARFVTGRATLRRLAGEMIDAPPEAVPIGRSPSGRPLLLVPADWSVSLAHTHDLVVAAIAGDADIGVDVEPGDRTPPAPDRWCSALEADAVRATPPAQRQAVLLRLWTAKEAMYKAVGGGDGLAFVDLDVLDAAAWGAERTVPPVGRTDPAVRWLTLTSDHLVALAERVRTFGPARPGLDRFSC
jgi:4'-phosphopantetheinyl transferase